MAADLRFAGELDLSLVKKGFGEFLTMATKSAKDASAAFSIKGNFDDLKKRFRATIEELAREAQRLGGLDSRLPPQRPPASRPPRPPQESPNPPPPGPDPAIEAARLREQVETRYASLKARFSSDDAARDKELTDELVSNIGRLQEAKKVATLAMSQTQDKATKAHLAAEKKAAEEELTLLHQVLRQKASAQTEGAGAKVGFLGFGRKLLEGDLNAITGAIKSAAGNGAVAFQATLQSVQAVAGALNGVIQTYSEFEASSAAVSAVTGATGSKLEDLKRRGRELALEFGGSAVSQMESFQGVLSKFGPAVANNPEALGKMAKNINILSAASGDDAKTSMSAVTDSMLQFGLVTGDAAKDAETTTRIVNGLASSAQVGAAEIPQVAEAILQAGVASKGANLSFEATNAAIQVLAVGGKTGAAAGVALRNVLGLLQKASGPAEAAMKSMGTSSKELGELLTTQGLDVALQKLRTGLNGLGTDAERNKALMEIFGTENSAAAGILLDNVKLMREFETGIRAGQEGTGAAFEQAAIRMNTSQTMMARAKAFMDDALISIGEKVGNLTVAASGAIAQVAPALTAFSGIKTAFPDGGLKNLIPESAANSLKTIVGNMKTSFLSATQGAGGLGNMLKGVFSAGATGAGGLGASLVGALGPAAPWIAGIAAAIAAFVLLYNKVKPFRDLVDGIVEVLVDGWNMALPVIEQLGSLLIDVGGLWFEWFILPLKIAFASISAYVSAVINVIKSILSLIPGLGDAFKSGGSGISSFFTTVRKIIIDVQGVISGVTNAISAVGDKVGDILGKLGEGDIFGAIGEIVSFGDDVGEAFAQGFNEKVSEEMAKLNIDEARNALEAQLQLKDSIDKTNKIGELKKKLAEAKTDAEKNSISKMIAEQVPGAVESVKTTVDKTTGEISKTYEISASKLDEFIAKQAEANLEGVEGSKERQVAVVKGLAAELQQHETLASKLSDLNSRQAERKAAGLDTSEIDKEITETEEKLKEAGAKLQEDLKNAKASGLLENLGPDAQAAFDSVKSKYGETLAEMDRQAAEAKLGETLGSAARISGDLDANNSLKSLIEKFKNSKDEIEKSNLAAAIQKQVPGALEGMEQVVGKNGEIVTQYKINVQAAEEFAQAQEKSLSGEIQSKRTEFTNGLRAQADELANNRDKMTQLSQKIVEQSKAGKDVSTLRDEYQKLQGKVQENTASLAKTVEQGKKFGLIKGDVRDVGTEFGLTKRQADSTALATASIGDAARNAAVDAQSLSKEFQNAREAASSALTALKGELVGILAKLQTEQDAAKKAELQRVYDQKLAEAKAAARGTIEGDRIIKQVEEAIGDTSLADVERRRKEEEERRKKAQDDAEKRAREAVERRKKILDDQLKDLVQAQKEELDKLEEGLEKEQVRRRQALDILVASKKFEEELDRISFKQKEITEAEVNRRARERELERQNAEKALNNFRVTEGRKLAADLIKAEDDVAKVSLELRKATNDTLVGEDSATVKRRGDEALAILKVSQQQQVESTLGSNAEFQKAFEERGAAEINALFDAQLALEKANSSKDETLIAQAKTNLGLARDAVENVMAETRGDFLSNLMAMTPEALEKADLPIKQLYAQIKTLQINGQKEADALTKDSRDKLYEAETRERVAKLVSLADQERELAIASVQKTLDETLRREKDNEARRLEAVREAAKKRYEIELEYAKKTSVAYRIYTAVKEGILEAFTAKTSDEAKKQTEIQRSEIAKQLALLIEETVAGRRQLTSFYDEARKLREKRTELEKKGGEEGFQLDEAIRQAGIISSKKYNDEQTKRVDKASSEYEELWNTAQKKRLNNEKLSDDELKALSDKSGERYAELAAFAVGQFGQLAAEGKSIQASFLGALIDSAAKWLASMIPVWVAGIFGTTVGQMGVLGLATSAILTGTLLGLAGAAKSALKLRDGMVNIPGRGDDRSDSNLTWYSVGESMLNARATRAKGNAPFFEWANKTGGSIFDYARSTGMGFVMPVPVMPSLEHLEVTSTGIIDHSRVVDAVKENTTAVREQTMIHRGEYDRRRREVRNQRRKERVQKSKSRGGRWKGN